MRKHTFLPIFLFALVSFCCNSLQADISTPQLNSLEQRVSALEQKKSTGGMINPVGRPEVRDGADIFFMADFLVWQAHENGLSYAVKGQSGQPTASALYNSSAKTMHFDWDCGFRVGFGWNTPHDGWDILTNWTWFENTAHGKAEVSSSALLLSTDNYPAANEGLDGFRSAQAKWRLHLNLIDVELGREFFVSKWMTLRPFIGVRSGWVHQKKIITLGDATPSDSQKGALTIDKCNFWGFGPRSGLNTQWGLGCGFSIIGNGAVSILYGNFQGNDLQQQRLSGTSNNTVVNNTDSVRVSRAISELVLGLRWDKMLADDSLHLGIQAGWENLMFFGQNQFKNFSGTTQTSAGNFVSNQGDLTIQGWTLSARLDF